MAVEWNTSLFGCAEDKDICNTTMMDMNEISLKCLIFLISSMFAGLLTCFCPCIQIGRNIEVITEKKPGKPIL